MNDSAKPASDNEKPPILGSWKELYAAVIIWLAVLITVFYLMTRYFS